MSIGLTVGGWFASAFVETLVEKASSYSLQQLGQRSDLHGEVRQLGRSLLTARAVLRIAERKQQRNKDDEELLRKLLLQLKDAAYDAEDLLGDLDYVVLCQKIAKENKDTSNVKKAARREAQSTAGQHFHLGEEIKWSAGAAGDANELRTQIHIGATGASFSNANIYLSGLFL